MPDIDLAIPLAPELDPWRHDRESTNFLRIVARAREGSSAAAVAADLEDIGKRLQQEFPGTYARKKGVLVTPFREELTRNFSRTLVMSMAAVGLLLLVACANLANLMLARATARRQEMAIRRALGARPARLARELLVEAALLSFAGALLGLLLAWWTVPALVALSPTAMPRSQGIGLNGNVLAFTATIAVVAGLGFGLAPVWRVLGSASKRDLSSGRRGTGTADGSRARGAIVAAQVSVMVVLLTGASLLYRSFLAVMRIEPGFAATALTVRISLPLKDYPDNESISRFFEQLEERLLELPGVESVAGTNQLPLNGAIASADYKVADRPPASEDQLPTALYRMVTPDYFRTMGIPVLAGRAFGDLDRVGAPPVAIVSQSFVRESFPDRDPLGLQLLVKDTPEGFRPIEIVGVAGDVHHGSLETAPEPHIYVPYHQVPRNLLIWLAQTQFVVVRAEGDSLALGEAVKHAVDAVDPNVASAGARLSGYLPRSRGGRAPLQRRLDRDVRPHRARHGSGRNLRSRLLHRRPAHSRDRPAARARRPSARYPLARARRGFETERVGNRRRSRRRLRGGARVAEPALRRGSVRPRYLRERFAAAARGHARRLLRARVVGRAARPGTGSAPGLRKIQTPMDEEARLSASSLQ